MLVQKYEMSTAQQLLLRYSLQKGYTPIVKATNPSHLISNTEAENLVILEEDMAVLDSWDMGIAGSLCMLSSMYPSFLLIRHECRG